MKVSVTITLVVSAVLATAAIMWLLLRTDQVSTTSPRPTGNELPMAARGENAPTGTLALPEPPELPPPRSAPIEPVVLREHRVAGSRFACTAVGNVSGRAKATHWMVVQGGAHFQYFSEVSWITEMLENDGTTIVERRTFTEAKYSSLITPTEVVITPAGHTVMRGVGKALALLSGGNPAMLTISGAFLVADKELQGDLLSKAKAIPGAGPWLCKLMEKLATGPDQHRQVQAVLKVLARIEGNVAELTWRDGRLVRCEWTDRSSVMTPEDRDVVARFAIFADARLLPDQLGMGERRLISASDVASLIAFDYEGNPDAVQGRLILQREPDAIAAEVAQLSGSGTASFLGERYQGDLTIDTFRTEVVYGPSGPTRNRFIKQSYAKGRMHYAKLPESHPLFGVVMTVEPKFQLEYTAALLP